MQVTTLSYHEGNWSAPLPAWDSPQTLVLVFAARTLETDEALWSTLTSHYPASMIAGCSSAGEILQDRVEDDSASIAVIRFDHTPLKLAHTQTQAGDSRAAGQRLAASLIAPDLKGVLLLSDGLVVNGSELVAGLIDSLPAGIQITGGLAGDAARFEHTWVLVDGKPARQCITAIGFYGQQVMLGFGSRGGWDLFGPERQVTRADGNIVYELDGNPALTLYKQYLGDEVKNLPGSGLLFPLAIKTQPGEEPIVRTLLAVDEDQQTLIFAGDVPQGSVTQLMRANFDRLIEGAENAAEQIQMNGQGERLAIAISCVGRKLILKSRIDEEVEATLDALPEGTRQIGFYSYGELSPSGALSCSLHNQTMTLTLIGEA